MYDGQKSEKALSGNAQLQWVIQGIGAYKTLKVTLENHITNITNKVDSNHEILKEKLDDKHDSVLARMDERFNALQEKIDNKCNVLVQTILRSEQSVLNQIKNMQSTNLKWFIGIIAGTGIVFYKVFTMNP